MACRRGDTVESSRCRIAAGGLPLVDEHEKLFSASRSSPPPLLSPSFFLVSPSDVVIKVSASSGRRRNTRGLTFALPLSISRNSIIAEMSSGTSSPLSSYPTTPPYSPPLLSTSNSPPRLAHRINKSLHIKTPLIYSPVLSSKARANVYLKLEQVRTGTFIMIEGAGLISLARGKGPAEREFQESWDWFLVRSLSRTAWSGSEIRHLLVRRSISNPELD